MTSAASPGSVDGSEAQEGNPLAVVGIGASAGGLKALQRFFEAVSADSGLAYVVIMHLDAERESRMAALLQSRTNIPVMQVEGTSTVQADRVYIIPPGHDLEMRGANIHVVEREDRPQHAPIDRFFRTLAMSFGADAIGVVMSGTGEDGAAGIRHIKEHGGITVAQQPADAEYEGMPGSAIATGQVDLVLPAAEIAAELRRLRRMPTALPIDASPADNEAALKQILSALRGRTGHDFSPYKRATVLRRLERRLRFNGVNTLRDYLPLLRENEMESRALVRDLLISVSGFFRDPEAFAALSDVIPTLFEGKGPEDSVRVWVVGCATGEEAYSIAMLLNEYAATLAHPPRFQMFATDIDEKGYSWGREGLYPPTAVGDIQPDRLRRFFTMEQRGFRVVKSLREGVLFAAHNVLRDPPFAKLDLISCRNLMIYLQPEAQDRVVETFHYALRPGGVLFLGASETVGEGGLFLPISEPQRLYRRDAAPNLVAPRISAADLSSRQGHVQPAGAAEDARRQPFPYGALHMQMLEAYAPPSLIVNEKLDVVHRSSRAGEFLHLAEGEPSHNLIEMSRGDLRMELRTALYQAFNNGLPTSRSVNLNGKDGRSISLLVMPGAEDPKAGRFALVIFDEQPPAEVKDHSPAESADRRAILHLEEELRRTKEQLESVSGRYDHTVEALQLANEEMQSVNEEEKAAAEELETSREEIQSINEELTTINQEYQATIEELKRTNADLQNLIESTEIGTIFLDGAMRVRRYTPSIGVLFNFVPTDQGRPLAHITHQLDYPDLLEDTQNVMTTRSRIEREVCDQAGEWYIVRVNPYRSLDHGDDGAVLTFFNSTARKAVEDELREAKIAAESANLSKATFLATLSHEFRTPLNGMLGYADLLQFDGPLTAAQAIKIERIKAGGWHLVSMIDTILSFAKLDAGRESVRYERIDANELARNAVALVEPAAKVKGLELLLDIPIEAVVMETDGGKVRQILINICGNAVKYTEKGEIRVHVFAEQDHVVFEVRDTGIGIAPGDLGRIFGRFWQVDSGTTRSIGGLGIGLTAAQEFSWLLGGDIEVESEVGSGSIFRVWLPRQRERPELRPETRRNRRGDPHVLASSLSTSATPRVTQPEGRREPRVGSAPEQPGP